MENASFSITLHGASCCRHVAESEILTGHCIRACEAYFQEVDQTESSASRRTFGLWHGGNVRAGMKENMMSVSVWEYCMERVGSCVSAGYQFNYSGFDCICELIMQHII